MTVILALVQAHPFMTAYLVASALGHIPGFPGAALLNRFAANLKPKADAEGK